MSERIKSFLGTGWSFPPAFDRISNGVRLSSDIADVEESIRIILGTTPGERIMQPAFGCNINRLVFEEIRTDFISKLTHEVSIALLNYEPRVKFGGLEIIGRDEQHGLIYIRITYTLIITNTRHNLVYPFYIVEGTNVSV